MTNCTNWFQWLTQTRFSSMSEQEKINLTNSLNYVRDNVIGLFSKIEPNDTIIDIGTGTGLLAFGLLEKISEDGLVIFSDISKECLEFCEKEQKEIFPNKNAQFLYTSCENIDLPDGAVDKVTMRSVLCHIVDKQNAINEIYRILKPSGEFVAFEPLLSTNVRYHELTNAEQIENYEEFKRAENQIMSDKNNSLTNFDGESLKRNFEVAGFTNTEITIQNCDSSYTVCEGMVKKWFEAQQSPNLPSMKDRFLDFFDVETVNKYILDLEKALINKQLTTRVQVMWIKAIK
ncbi:class I SAM-dependent methyltransferase [bacterium]|nr:class I SAM-dependent methyltransferase [bacterium]